MLHDVIAQMSVDVEKGCGMALDRVSVDILSRYYVSDRTCALHRHFLRKTICIVFPIKLFHF